MPFMSLFLYIFANMSRKKIIKWVKITLTIYILGGVALYFLQDAILFHPVILKRDHKYNFKEPHEDISIAMNNEDTLNLSAFSAPALLKKELSYIFMETRKTFPGMRNTLPTSPVMDMK